jgi:hypothetical protein
LTGSGEDGLASDLSSSFAVTGAAAIDVALTGATTGVSLAGSDTGLTSGLGVSFSVTDAGETADAAGTGGGAILAGLGTDLTSDLGTTFSLTDVLTAISGFPAFTPGIGLTAGVFADIADFAGVPIGTDAAEPD